MELKWSYFVQGMETDRLHSLSVVHDGCVDIAHTVLDVSVKAQGQQAISPPQGLVRWLEGEEVASVSVPLQLRVLLTHHLHPGCRDVVMDPLQVRHHHDVDGRGHELCDRFDTAIR